MMAMINAQVYNIETDSLYDTGDMSMDIPFTKIHPYSGKVKTAMVKKEEHETLVSILNGSTETDIPLVTIECRHYKDFYYLLYSLCERSVLCSEAYFIDKTSTVSTVPKANFKKFVHQLALSQLFLVTGTETPQNHELFLLEDNTPIAWIPHYRIQLNDLPTQSLCSESFDTMSATNVPFVHSTLYLLHLYKTYVVNEYRCTHYNEWLELDAHNHGVCVCKHGKSCDLESNYRHIIVAISVIMVGVVLIWIVTFYINTHRSIQKIDAVTRGKHQKSI